MGRIKEMMMDFCDCAEIPFDEIDNPAVYAAFKDFCHVASIIKRIQLSSGERRLRWSTKLWNAIDCMEAPEPHWRLMLHELPDCFDRHSVNCLKFTY